jgi:hypothetical protein
MADPTILGIAMTESDYARKLDEVDRLLNDPERRMEPDRVWSLLAEIARYQAATEPQS